MSFLYNSRGVAPSAGGGSNPIPAGSYLLKIIDTEETQSKRKEDGTGGYPQVVVTFMVAEGDYQGRKIPFHRVTFQPKGAKGAGVAVHFLKCLGQPFGGEDEVNHLNWRGKFLRAEVFEEAYNGYVNNKIGEVQTPEGVAVPQEEEAEQISW